VAAGLAASFWQEEVIPLSLRGKAAVVGFSELPTLRNYPGRTTNSLCSEAIRLAIADAGLTVAPYP
jgi:hypothetical protein